MSDVLVVHPHRLRRACRAAAAALVLVFAVAALLLRRSATGVTFGVGDQIAVFGIGVLLAAAVLLAGRRPAVVADERGLRVRGMISERDIGWDLVRAVRFPDRSPWALLDLLDDETVALLAVQAADGERTVAAVATLRDLHARSRPVDH